MSDHRRHRRVDSRPISITVRCEPLREGHPVARLLLPFAPVAVQPISTDRNVAKIEREPQRPRRRAESEIRLMRYIAVGRSPTRPLVGTIALTLPIWPRPFGAAMISQCVSLRAPKVPASSPMAARIGEKPGPVETEELREDFSQC